jgi:Ca-activated chloride channel family protein
VLCRFTAWVAVDERVVTEGGQPHRVVQPVELPSGWEPPVAAAPMMLAASAVPAPPTYAPAATQPMERFSAPLTAGPGRARGPRSGRSLVDRLRRRDDGASTRTGGGALPAEAAPEPIAAAPISDAVREVAAREARRLRAAAGAPEYERRELLADLGTRLDALTAELPGGSAVVAVRSLVAALAEDRLAEVSGAELAQLWDRALAVLDTLAAGGAVPGGASPGEASPGEASPGGAAPGGASPSGSGRERPFWNRS